MIKVPVEEEELLLCAVRFLDSFLILYTTAATSSLSVYSPHLQRASFCRFHPSASLFISATLTLTSPSVFSLLLFYVWRPPPHQWAIGLSFGPLRSSKHLHLSSNPYLLFLLFVLNVAVAPIALSATLHSLPHRSVRWDETLPTRWHSQIKNLHVHLSDLLRLYFEFPFLTKKNWRNFDSVALLSWRHLAISVYQTQMFSKKLRKQDNLQL